jgi:hypothetical protein
MMDDLAIVALIDVLPLLAVFGLIVFYICCDFRK